jgi:ADP-ribosylglycohydrolase
MVLASFVADSHALGAHWIYDMDEIASRFGRVEQLLPAAPGSYHNGRARGEFTHYGDQTLILLRHLASSRGFDADAFSASWRAAMSGYSGYIDHATKTTLENLDRGVPAAEAGSPSKDLSAAARIAPLAYLYRDDASLLADQCEAQARLTHNDELVALTARTLGTVLWNALNGKTPSAALEACALTNSGGGKPPAGADADPRSGTAKTQVAEMIRAGLSSTSLSTREAAERFGQGCGVSSALPLAVHMVAKYEGSLHDALIENVAAGGDSAARGMVVGMILGAFHGRDAIPDGWLSELRAYTEISTLLEDLEAAHQRAEAVGD